MWHGGWHKDPRAGAGEGRDPCGPGWGPVRTARDPGAIARGGGETDDVGAEPGPQRIEGVHQRGGVAGRIPEGQRRRGCGGRDQLAQDHAAARKTTPSISGPGGPEALQGGAGERDLAIRGRAQGEGVRAVEGRARPKARCRHQHREGPRPQSLAAQPLPRLCGLGGEGGGERGAGGQGLAGGARHGDLATRRGPRDERVADPPPEFLRRARQRDRPDSPGGGGIEGGEIGGGGEALGDQTG